MCEYVDRQQIQRYDRKCRKILEELRQLLREDYGISSQISLDRKSEFAPFDKQDLGYYQMFV